MKKITAILLTVAIVGLVAAGCSKSEDAAAPASTGTDAAPPAGGNTAN
jgi:nitrous oxide reductase accessory protein NosL